MIWADKLVVFLAFTVFVLVGTLWLFAPDGGPFQSVLIWDIQSLKLFLPLWLILRGLDWAAGGAAKRRLRRIG